ncbi:hypothetical protein BDV96DRAFT_651151 [Lophiotrema nucula]|uniref:Hydrophobic surface binding protein A-domain-containing protein n=1 Tax=Lophiotrema nucula TaxID=690887 RepID=A0A6A5YVE2_9PLEO|nr:hypothetical protein BDV96DRAFT_651151 [Lophiotrema nucula]
MRFSTLLFASIAAAAPAPVGNGIKSIADSLLKTSKSLSGYSDTAVSASAHLSYDTSANIDPTVDLTKALNLAALELWASAYDVEQKACAIAKSINEQTTQSQIDALSAAVTAEAQAVLKLKTTVQTVVDKIKPIAMAFTSSEKSAVETAIKALAKSAEAAVAPLIPLASGLKGVGVSGVYDSVDDLKGAVTGLVSIGSAVSLPPW